jgi:D-Tyr-tRNAtyr deacylase
MRFVVQRVTSAKVEVEGNVTGEIGTGFFVLIGVEEADDSAVADKLISKLIGLRIFSDENDKTNLSIRDVDGSMLLVSQFTLYADCRKGNRPSFIKAGRS